MVEEGMTRVERERRLAVFLETQEQTLSMSYFDNLCVEYIAADSDDEETDASGDGMSVDNNNDDISDDEPWP